MCDELQQRGQQVNRKRVQRLMRQMGLRVVHPKLAWRISNTLETDACGEALEDALACYGAPEIFNTDQGAHYTSEAFTAMLKDRG